MYYNTNKVNRCRARYSPRARTKNQTTNRAPNEHQNVFFGANIVVFRQREQMYWYSHIRKPPSHLSVEVRFFLKSLDWIKLKHSNRKRVNMSTIELRRVFPALEATSLDGCWVVARLPNPFYHPVYPLRPHLPCLQFGQGCHIS